MTLYNLARMTTATTGTGTIVLGSAVSGYLTFDLAGVTNGATVSYGIRDGYNSEVGRGVYDSTLKELTRVVLKSTNSNNAINLTGAAEVYITALAEDFTGGVSPVSPSVVDEVVVFSDLVGGQKSSGHKLTEYALVNSPITIGTPSNGLGLGGGGAELTINLASATQIGALSSTDWSTFNSKEPAIAILPASKGGTGIANGASATLTLPNFPITIAGGVTGGTYTLPATSQTLAGLAVTGQTFTTTQQITVPTTTLTGLILKTSDDNATKNLFEAQSSIGTALTTINSSGYISIGANYDVAGTGIGLRVTKYSTATGNVAIIGTMRPATNNPSLSGISASLIFNTNTTFTQVSGSAPSALKVGMTIGPSNPIIGEMSAWSLSGQQTNGTVTKLNYFLISDLIKTGGTRTAQYGLYVEDLVNATTNYAVYTGKGLNRLGDQLSIVGWQDVQQLKATGHTTQTLAPAQITRNDTAAGVSAMLGLTALGSGAAGDGGSILFAGKSSTTAATVMGLIDWRYIVATHASYTTALRFYARDAAAARLGLEIEASGTAVKLALFGGTTAIQQVLNAYTSDGEGAAYTGIDNAQAGTVYATVVDLNQLRVAYETLRASYDDLRTKLQTSTLVA